MTTPQSYRSRATTVDAIQWTGDNLRAIQEFVAPASPLYEPGSPALRINVFDAVSTATYKTLGRQLKSAGVPPSGWIVKYSNGDLAVLTSEEFEAAYDTGAEAPFYAREIPAGTYTPGVPFPLGAPITATHPRAVGDEAAHGVGPDGYLIHSECDECRAIGVHGITGKGVKVGGTNGDES